MKKFILCLGLLLIVSGCSWDRIVDEPSKTDDITYLEVIKTSDNKTIYTETNDINYKENKKNLINELKNGTVSIEDVIKEIAFLDGLNDGGTEIYLDDSKVFDKKIYIYKCHSIMNNKDGQVIDTYNEDYYITLGIRSNGICRQKD